MGGVVLREKRDNSLFVPTVAQEKTAFDEFFDNSTVSLLSANSRGGILFKMDLNKGIDSPYVLCRSQSPWTPVDSILLKLCCFSFNGIKNTIIDLNSLTHEEFENEVNIQKEIYSASLDDKLEPICPSVVHTEIIESSGVLKFLGKMQKKIDDRDKLYYMLFESRGLIDGFGLIVMEYLEGFEPMRNLLEEPTTTPEMEQHYHYCVCYEMIRMYDLTGYLHGDFHQFNFMVNPTYSYFGDDAAFSGRAVIIDFGSSFKPPLKRKIALNYKKKNTGAIPILKLNLEHKTPTLDESFVIRDWPSYQWLEPFFIDDTVAAETEKQLIEYNNMRNRFIEFWMQTIGGSAEPSDVEEPSVPMDVSPVPTIVEEPSVPMDISPAVPTGKKVPAPVQPRKPSSRIAAAAAAKKKGGKIMDAFYRPTNKTEPTTYYAKNKEPTIQPTIMKKSTKSMFPEEFAGKIAEIQQYVAMDKLANQPNK
jgi:hypothetical protein